MTGENSHLTERSGRGPGRGQRKTGVVPYDEMNQELLHRAR